MHNYFINNDIQRETNNTANMTLSKDERYAVLTGEFRNVAHNACLNQISFESLRVKICNISKELMAPKVQPEKNEIQMVTQNPKRARCKGRPSIKRSRSLHEGIKRKKTRK